MSKKQNLSELGRQKAEFVKKFIGKYCSHTKGEWAGRPFSLIPWQEDIIDKAFGTLRPDGRRQYRIVYVEIPKKNGKTELMAALALYMLVADGEHGAEVYSAAADRDQASLTYLPMSEMVRNNKRLSERLTVLDSRRRIIDQQTFSFYQVLSAETFTKHGLNPSAVFFDELHAQPTPDLWEVLTAGTDYARSQQLIVVATTAGVYDPQSIWWKVREKAIKVQQGLIEDPQFLPILYIADKEKDNPDDEEVWIRNNPSLNHIFDLNKIREDFKIAKQSPSEYNNFLRFRLNIPVASVTRWIMPEAWSACNTLVDSESLKGQLCYGGLDLSTTTDISALVLVFPPEDEDGKYQVLTRFFIPEDNMIQRSHRDRVPYLEWCEQGYITATPGNVIDYSFIIAQIMKDAEDYDLREIAFDRWGSTKIIQDLQELGFERPQENKKAERRLIDFGQGYASMSSPTKELEKLILSGKIAHGGNPVLAWMASNVVVSQDAAGNIKPDKGKSIERIDGIVSLIMGVSRAVAHETEESVYNERGLMLV